MFKALLVSKKGLMKVLYSCFSFSFFFLFPYFLPSLISVSLFLDLNDISDMSCDKMLVISSPSPV